MPSSLTVSFPRFPNTAVPIALAKGIFPLMGRARVAKATKGLGVVSRIGARAVTSGTVATAQEGEVGRGTGIAAGVEVGLPVAGKLLSPAVSLIKRLLKGIGGGLSGMSSGQLEATLATPKTSRAFVKQIRDSGGSTFLRKEATTIVKGIKDVGKEASDDFGKALDALPEVAQKPLGLQGLKAKLTTSLREFGVEVSPKKATFNFTESPVVDSEEKVLTKVFTLINNWKDVTPKGLNNLAVKIGRFEKASSNVQLNTVIGGLKKNVRNYLGERVPAAKAMVDKFSKEQELLDEIQVVFGKEKFGSGVDILKVSKRLEGLFTEKGLSDDVITKFLERIGADPVKFRAGEAVRQIGELASTANTVGTSPFEIIRSITAAIVPPKAVRAIAIQLGIAENVVKEITTKLSPATRGALIRDILGDKSENINR